jgi:hypothetical protein
VALFSTVLQNAGCDCVTLGPDSGMTDGETGSVDAYVQLPAVIETTGTSVMRRLRDLLTQGLVARFENAESALPKVRDDGLVVLVAGNSPGGPDVATIRQRARRF